MAGNNITDQDILAALRGSPGPADRSGKEVSDALHGRPTAGEHAQSATIAKAFGREPQRTVGEGALPLQRRGDDLEAVAIWAAKESAAAATKSLAEAIMRTNGSKGIYAAEAEAAEIAAEAYAEAAKGSPYEDRRQEAVTRIVTKLAEKLSSSLAGEAKASTAAPPALRRGHSPKPPVTRESSSMKRAWITEVARPGTIDVIE